MTEPTLTPAQEQVLRSQVFDLEHPGPVLRDFQVVLDFIGSKGVRATGKYHMLPISCIHELDEKLSRPLHLDLKRPQLRSHPYLHGLHLLLRASGIARVAGRGDKARLVLHPETLESWKSLNPCEQYFTLLEAWLRLADANMIGEREFLLSSYRPRLFIEGICLITDGFQLALMELFGLAKLKNPPVYGPNYNLGSRGVQETPWGEALFALLATEPLDEEDEVEEEEANGEEPAESDDEEEDNEDEVAVVNFGVWQPLVQPYCPAWQENLVCPLAPFQDGEFFFKVSLGEIWRRIAISASSTLEDLMGVILNSVKFDWDHLYTFSWIDEFGVRVEAGEEAMDTELAANEVLIGELPLVPGDALDLIYDYGDNWEFTVTLEKIEPASEKDKPPRIVEKHGKSPKQYPNSDW